MKIFYLSVRNVVGYDSYDAKVVIAVNECNARKMANENTGDEGDIWQDKDKVSCRLIRLMSEVEGVLLASFNAG